jgi:hypothetical protein
MQRRRRARIEPFAVPLQPIGSGHARDMLAQAAAFGPGAPPMIRPVSSNGGVPPTEFAAAAESAPGASIAAHVPSAPDVAATRHGDDALAKLRELLGDPSHTLSFYADKGGSSGSQGVTTSKTDPLVGAELPGQKGVVIQRSLGDPKGYETRNHALAWARATGSDTAMVVLGKDKRWHAVETNKVGQSTSAGNGKVAQAIQVGKVDPAEYKRLKQAAMENNDPEKWKTFAAYALGVPRDEINVVKQGDTPSRTMVNINLTRDFDAEGKTAGFDPAQPPWVQLGPSAFDRPANACATLAHEQVHAEHHTIARELFAKYTEYQHKHPHSKESFRDWASAAAKSDPQQIRNAEIVSGLYDGAHAATEQQAHIEAARVAFASGDLEQARTDLNKMARLPVVPAQRQTNDLAVEELKDLRDSLGADALKVFNEVAQKAPSRSPMHDKALQSH